MNLAKVVFAGLLSLAPIHAGAQTWPNTTPSGNQIQWGLNKTVSPYQIGINLLGTWYPTGTISASGTYVPSGVPTFACATHTWVSSGSSLGVPVCTQPAFSDISGTIAADQLIAPGATTFGAVKSSTAPSNNFATGISTAGAVTYAQPTYANISGGSGITIPNPQSAATASTNAAGVGTFLWSYNSGNVTANSIYQAIYPGVASADVLQAVQDIASGSTTESMPAASAYVRNRSSSGANGVSYFGAGKAEVNNSKIWGVNTLCQDADTRAIGTGTGRYCIGSENDLNIMNPGTVAIGISVGGNSLAQPTVGWGFVVNPLGTGIKWPAAFSTMSGATDKGVVLGAKETSGTNVDSQEIQLSYFDGAAAAQTAVIKMSAGFLSVSGTAAISGFSLGTGSFYVGSGYGYSINGTPALGLSGGLTSQLAKAGVTTTVGDLAFKTQAAISTDISGLGTGVATALGNAVDGSGGVLTYALLSTANTWTQSQTAPNWLTSAAAPTQSSCGGSPSIDAGSNANSGKFTIGSAATACTLTFAVAYPTNAYCTVTPMAAPSAIGNVPYISAQSKTAFTVSGGTASASYTYSCGGN